MKNRINMHETRQAYRIHRCVCVLIHIGKESCVVYHWSRGPNEIQTCVFASKAESNKLRENNWHVQQKNCALRGFNVSEKLLLFRKCVRRVGWGRGVFVWYFFTWLVIGEQKQTKQNDETLYNTCTSAVGTTVFWPVRGKKKRYIAWLTPATLRV